MDERLEYPVCRDCEHCVIVAMGHFTAAYECKHPRVTSVDKVTGAKYTGDCSHQRSDNEYQCGIEGRLWKKKIPWWAKFADRIGMLNVRIDKT